MNPTADALIALSMQVRERTLGILRRADDAALTWTPKGTVNHLIWHAGHALWVQDALCIAPLSGESQLPDGWAKRFGMESQPGADAGPWPSRELLIELLGGQLQRIEAVLTAADPAVLAQMQGPGPAEPGMGWLIVHGLHDEAIHQGEMRMLLKLWKAYTS